MLADVFGRVADFVGVRSESMREALRLVFVDGLSQARVLERVAVPQQSLSRAVVAFKKSVSDISGLAADIDVVLVSGLSIAYGGMNGADVVVRRPSAPHNGLYPATELAILYCAYYGVSPVYKLLDGVVVATRPGEGSLLDDVDYADLRSSRVHGVRGLVAAAGRRALLSHTGGEEWEHVDCAAEIQSILEARKARGLERF